MPGAPGRVPLAQNRVGLSATVPLHQRCDQLRQRIAVEIPAGEPERQAMNLYDSEFHLDAMITALMQYRKRKEAEAPPDPWAQAALRALQQERTAYHSSWQELRELQRK